MKKSTQRIYVGLNNLKNHEPSTDFVYPDEDGYLEKLNKKKAIFEIINFLLNEIMASGNPKNYIAALAVAAGIDLEPTCKTNTTSVIAKQLGVSQQTFSKQVNRLRKKFGFPNRKKKQ